MRGRYVEDSNNEPDPPDFATDLAAGLGELFRQHDDSMILGYVILAKVMDNKGDQAFHTIRSQGLGPWDTYGMLKFAMVREEAQQHEEWHNYSDGSEGTDG